MNDPHPLLGLRALSIRQPWPWAIFNLGKDIENRTHAAIKHMVFAPGEIIAIHASKGMTQDEYDDASGFFRQTFGVSPPPARELPRGGIVGSVRVGGIVAKSDSKWFFGPRGILLSDAKPCEFMPARGMLGLFRWTPGDANAVPKAARWMTPIGKTTQGALL